MAKEWIVPDTDLGCDGAYFDYQEIVRCKDCKYYQPIGICIEQSSAVCADSFCCWAERRTDETD